MGNYNGNGRYKKDDYERSEEVRFINPYTFVPVQKNRKLNREDLAKLQEEKLHTGVLKCRLHVVTPLGIPDAEKVKGKTHLEYPFFSCGEGKDRVLMIPGSSLRGPLRSVFETATDSCFSTLREDTGLSRRTDVNKAYKPGILEIKKDGTLNLYKADRYLMPSRISPENLKRIKSGDFLEIYRQLEKEENTLVSVKNARGNHPRKVVTQKGVELKYGDFAEFSRSNTKSYVKRGIHIWNGYASNVTLANDLTASGTSKRLRGIVYVGESFGKKHGESIFVRKGGPLGYKQEVLKKAYRSLKESLEIYRDPAINKEFGKTNSGYAGFENAAGNGWLPIWYNDDAALAFSMASVGRTFFNSTLNDLVGFHKPCTSRAHLCEACALFGMAQEESLGSRIRITDAVIDGAARTEESCLKILGQPRYSYLPFYAKLRSGEVPGSYDENGAEIAGRKFYWHDLRAREDASVYRTEEKNQMNNSLELVMPGAEFTFNIYYDGITQDQLNKLMWCIHLGENRPDSSLCHKMGRGKPLGLGSVKLTIEERLERSFESGQYTWETDGLEAEAQRPEFRKENWNALLKVLDLNGAGASEKVQIRYPYLVDKDNEEFSEEQKNRGKNGKPDNRLANHVWYRENKKAGRKGKLPEISKADQSIPAYRTKNI